MSINRKAPVAHSLFAARAGGTPADADLTTFERVALREGANLSAWKDIGRGGVLTRGSNHATVADVLDLRGQLTAFKDTCMRKAKDLSGVGNGGAMGAADDLLVAAEVATRAIQSATATIGQHDNDGRSETRASSEGHRTAQADRGSTLIRSGADWLAAMPDEGDEMRAASEDGDASLADFLAGAAGMRSSEWAKRALSIGTDTAGGFAIPSVVFAQVLDALVPQSSLLSAGAQLLKFDAPADGGKSYTLPAVNVLPTAAWRLEAGTVAESDPTFRAVTATPRSLSFMFKVSRELLADGVGMNAALQVAIAQAFAKEMDRAGLRGTGTAPEPRGIKNVSGIQTVTNGANGASLASSIKWTNLLSAVQSVLAADAPMPTAAIMSPRSLVGFGGLLDSTGQPARRPELLAPMKFIATSAILDTNTTGTSTDTTELYIGDFSSCRFILREAPSIQVLRERYADTGQIAFMCHARVDFVPLYPAAVAFVSGIRP